LVFFITGIILILIGAIALVLYKINKNYIDEDDTYTRYNTGCLKIVSLVLVVLGLVVVITQCFYTQDAGDVKVLRDFGGNIAGSSTETGLHLKAPWQDVITYDIRNNVISFVADGEESFDGGSANGPQVTINDSGGASANIDIQVNYSLNPDNAIQIYQDYGTQENFVRSIAAVDMRSVPREVAGQFDTITILTNRGELTQAIQDRLTEKWAAYGLNVEQVSIQEVRYSEDIVNKYAEAQQAEIAKQTALNDQERVKVESETKVIQANADAEANRILNESLSDDVLQQKYIDALKEIGANGSLVVVPENSQPIVNTNK
jgi:regulator of protease activity HflC (stomatin/prohibitin superfamily)